MEADRSIELDIEPCENCDESAVEPGGTVRFVEYHPVNDGVDPDADAASARPMYGVVCRACGTPRGAVTRSARHRLEGDASGDGEPVADLLQSESGTAAVDET